jgi:hypothetical protein
VKKACAAKARLELEWKDASGACGRLATSLVDNRSTLSPDESQSLAAKLDIVRDLSDKLKKDLDSHLLSHGCARDCYQQIVKLLEHLAEKHTELAELFDTVPNPEYAEGDRASAHSERLTANRCSRVATSIRTRLRTGAVN